MSRKGFNSLSDIVGCGGHVFSLSEGRHGKEAPHKYATRSPTTGMPQPKGALKFLLERKAARYGLLLGTALLNISWTFGSLYIDSHRYLRVASFFLGVVEVNSFDPTTMSYFVFRPLVPFLASLLSPFVGLENGFALVSSVFWLGSAILLFHFTRQLTGSETVGFWTALLFNFSVPVLMFGAALMTDMASWFFLTLGLYLLASWRTEGSLLWFGAVGLVAGVGILARQTVLALVVVGVLIVLSR